MKHSQLVFWGLVAGLALGVARGALGIALEEGCFKRFFNLIGITASS